METQSDSAVNTLRHNSTEHYASGPANKTSASKWKGIKIGEKKQLYAVHYHHIML